MTEFVVCYSTRDGVEAKLHAYRRGEGSIRDENHVREIVKCFLHGNEDLISDAAPSADERVLFEIHLGVKNTRRDGSGYFGWDYRRIEPCPQCVAEAGMDIFHQIKHVLRRAKNERKGGDMGKKCGGKRGGGKSGGKCGK